MIIYVVIYYYDIRDQTKFSVVGAFSKLETANKLAGDRSNYVVTQMYVIDD